MLSLTDPKVANSVLATLQITPDDKIISIRENSLADANFILTHLMKQIIYEKNRILLVSLHNTLDHYRTIGKKLGYDLTKEIKDGNVEYVDVLQELSDEVVEQGTYLQDNKEHIAKDLFAKIQSHIDRLLRGGGKQVYLIVDDLSHFLDLGVNVSHVIDFINSAINLISDGDISVVINTHVSTQTDLLVSNNLQYSADVHVDVAPLVTGRSNDVSGLIAVTRGSTKSHYQFKAYDRGIKMFHPGESIYHLYK